MVSLSTVVRGCGQWWRTQCRPQCACRHCIQTHVALAGDDPVSMLLEGPECIVQCNPRPMLAMVGEQPRHNFCFALLCKAWAMEENHRAIELRAHVYSFSREG